MSETLGAKNVIILGDFNAGGAYIRSQDWEKNRLRGPGFTWLIPDHMDTTATNTLSAYDRLDRAGEPELHVSAGVYIFLFGKNMAKYHVGEKKMIERG